MVGSQQLESSVEFSNITSFVLFYVLILTLGLWTSTWFEKHNSLKRMIVGKREFRLFTSIFTLAATWIGGEFFCGASAIVFKSDQGLLWAHVMLCNILGLVAGGLFFAEKMRAQRYVTMLDPFQRKYGPIICGLLFVPAYLGDLLWSAAILSSFGATLTVTTKLSSTNSIILSTALTLSHTILGGLKSVFYTDSVQLFWMIFGLWLITIFAAANPLLKPITSTALTRTLPEGPYGVRQIGGWLGEVKVSDAVVYIESIFIFILGGIPWQAYFQRVLSSDSARNAKLLSLFAALCCILMAVPSVLIGAVAVSADWQKTTLYNETKRGPINDKDARLILPLVLRHICPPAITFIGIGVITTAVLSAVNSSLLAAGSLFAHNVYKPIFCRSATDRQVIWSMRLAIVVVAVLACILAIKVTSIVGLWKLSFDLAYTVLFPQLFAVIYIEWSNSYGSLAGYIVSMALRLTAGESVIGLPALIRYPAYVEQSSRGSYQRFPVMTLCMLSSLTTLVCVSYITNLLFTNGTLPASWDVFQCVAPRLEKPVSDGDVDEIEAVIVASMQIENFPRHLPKTAALAAWRSTEQVGPRRFPMPQQKKI